METVYNFLIVLVSAAGMEFIAWFTHKHIMHGALWILHEDHHRPHTGSLEKNDLFTLFFAVIAMVLCAAGSYYRIGFVFSIGIGMSVYGTGYFLFHDVMFHKRIKIIRLKPFTPYLRRIIHAHAVHHQNSRGSGGTTFGFLYASSRYAGN